MLSQSSLPKWVAVVTLAAVSWGCAPKVQRQVTVLESVSTGYCHKDYKILGTNWCRRWKSDDDLDPFDVCFAGLGDDVISRGDFASLLEKGALVVGSTTELETLEAPFASDYDLDYNWYMWIDKNIKKNEYTTKCNVRKYIMEGNAAMFGRTSP